MNTKDLTIFVARILHADAILGKLATSENRSMYESLLKQLDIPKEGYDIPLYPIEVAIAHLMPLVFFLKLTQNGVDKELEEKIEIVRHALAHMGEYVNKEQKEPNLEFISGGGVVFRTKNNGGKEVGFKNVNELASFIIEIREYFFKNVNG